MTVVFALLGAMSGSFAARVPAIQAHLHVGAPRLGLALLGSAVGLVVSTPASGHALSRVAPRRWIAAGLLPAAVLLPLAAVVGSPWVLLAVLVGWGAASGMVDVAMNTEAAAAQRRAGRRVLSSVHAAYSIGALVGAGAGAACAAGAVGPLPQFAATSAVWVVGGAAATRLLPAAPPVPRVELPPTPAPLEVPVAAAAPSAPARPARRPRRLGWPVAPGQLATLAALAVACLACFLCEGAANDWSAVYLRTSTGARASVAAVAYAAFASTMVAGRLTGDRLATRLGPVRLVRAGGAVASLGLGAALAVGSTAAGVVGFALLGAGLAAGVPLVVSAAAALGPPATAGEGVSGPAVAAVVSVGYVGLLVGPAAIGGLAGLVGLRAALGGVAALAGTLVVLAGHLAPRQRIEA